MSVVAADFTYAWIRYVSIDSPRTMDSVGAYIVTCHLGFPGLRETQQIFLAPVASHPGEGLNHSSDTFDFFQSVENMQVRDLKHRGLVYMLQICVEVMMDETC
jgi:hypothetical protein